MVEDNATHRQILQQQLATWGFDCHAAPDGQSALALLRAAVSSGTPFPLAILDIQMPGMSGEELAQTIAVEMGAPLKIAQRIQVGLPSMVLGSGLPCAAHSS